MEKENTSLITSNLLGQTKHNPPANKEWVNSVYAYNKNNLRSLAVKDSMANKLIKSYFNLSVEKTIARSKRMRSLIRKSTIKRLFASNLEIKQTNDKVIVTVYTFDREKQFLLRKLYFNIVKWERLDKGIKRYKSKNGIIKKKKIQPKYFGLADLLRINNKLKKQNSLSISSKNLFIKSKNKFDIFNNNSLRNLKVKGKNQKLLKKLCSFKKVKQMSRNSGFAVSKKNSAKLFRKGKNILNRTILFKTKRNKKQFKPRKLIYKYKPWLRGTSKLNAFKRFLRKRYLMFNNKRRAVIEKKLPFHGFKHSKQMNLFYLTMNSEKRYRKAKKLLLYNYAVYLFSLLGVTVHSFEDTLLINKKKLDKLRKEEYEILESPKIKASVSKKKKNILIKKKVPYYIRRSQQYTMPVNLKKVKLDFYLKKNKHSFYFKKFSFNQFNFFLLSYLKSILARNQSQEFNLKLKDHFSDFSKKYFLDVFYKSLFYVKDKEKLKINLKKFNKDVLTINSLLKLIINRSKFGKFLLKLKLFISKIYSKKVELNVVNLKSPHLNTDIFTQAIAVKLRKRIGLLKVMRRSLQLVKLPYKFKTAAKEFDVNKLEILNQHARLDIYDLKKSINVKYKGLNYADVLENTLKTLYTRPLINGPRLVKNTRDRLFTVTIGDKNKNAILSKLTSVLNTIKYKWVTGVRLEAAGRLTRRYTASRSVFKYRYKGSLKNTDYSRKLDFLKNSMPNIILRNLVKSNSQHSFLKSKKRIGAFGLKTWISSY